MRQNAERAGDFEIVPRFDLVKRIGDELISFLQLPAQRRPFGVRNGFHAPAVLPVDHREFFVHIVAQKFEIKSDVLAVRGDRHAAVRHGARSPRGVDLVDRVEESRSLIEIHRSESRVRAFKSFLEQSKKRICKICLINCLHFFIFNAKPRSRKASKDLFIFLPLRLSVSATLR